MIKQKLNLNCPINKTGYGIASLNILSELNKIYDLSYFPIGGILVDNQEDYSMMNKIIENTKNCDPRAPTLKIWHQFDLLNRVGNGEYYAMSFFELDTFNETEKLHLRCPNRVFVSSKWAKDVVSDQCPSVITKVVPLGVNRSIFDETKYNTDQNDKYVFLNIGKWEIRKGHDVLLDMFQKAFPKDNENVELWILAPENTNGYSNEQEILKWKNMYSKDSRVKVFTGFDSHKDVASLIANSNCGIFPSRAEGWNLELLEMMSMNKPVITTNYSSHTEFCNNENSYLVNIKDKEKAYDGKAFNGQGHWAKIGSVEVDNFVDHMRTLYNNRVVVNPAGVTTSEKYSWTNTANHLTKYMETCCDGL